MLWNIATVNGEGITVIKTQKILKKQIKYNKQTNKQTSKQTNKQTNKQKKVNPFKGILIEYITKPLAYSFFESKYLFPPKTLSPELHNCFASHTETHG